MPYPETSGPSTWSTHSPTTGSRVAPVVGEYLGAVEHAFTESGSTQHEVNHVFRVGLIGVDEPHPLASLESHLEFFWQPVDRLKQVNLKPEPAIALVSGSSLAWASTLKNGA